MKCPDCDGRGSSNGMACGVRNGRRDSWMIEMKCSFCKGTGEATEAMMERRAFGEKLRTKRIGQNLSQRELCKQIGVADYPMYSRIEYGSHDGEIPEAVTQYLLSPEEL